MCGEGCGGVSWPRGRRVVVGDVKNLAEAEAVGEVLVPGSMAVGESSNPVLPVEEGAAEVMSDLDDDEE
jgi:hypothetical protein